MRVAQRALPMQSSSGQVHYTEGLNVMCAPMLRKIHAANALRATSTDPPVYRTPYGIAIAPLDESMVNIHVRFHVAGFPSMSNSSVCWDPRHYKHLEHMI